MPSGNDFVDVGAIICGPPERAPRISEAYSRKFDQTAFSAKICG
jgi:hypothetical protein